MNVIAAQPAKADELLREMYQWRQTTGVPVYDVQMYGSLNLNKFDVSGIWGASDGKVDQHDLLKFSQKWLLDNTKL